MARFQRRSAQRRANNQQNKQNNQPKPQPPAGTRRQTNPPPRVNRNISNNGNQNNNRNNNNTVLIQRVVNPHQNNPISQGNQRDTIEFRRTQILRNRRNQTNLNRQVNREMTRRSMRMAITPKTEIILDRENNTKTIVLTTPLMDVPRRNSNNNNNNNNMRNNQRNNQRNGIFV